MPVSRTRIRIRLSRSSVDSVISPPGAVASIAFSIRLRYTRPSAKMSASMNGRPADSRMSSPTPAVSASACIDSATSATDRLTSTGNRSSDISRARLRRFASTNLIEANSRSTVRRNVAR